MATHSSVLAWRIPGARGAWWGTVYGVAKIIQNGKMEKLSSSPAAFKLLSKVWTYYCAGLLLRYIFRLEFPVFPCIKISFAWSFLEERSMQGFCRCVIFLQLVANVVCVSSFWKDWSRYFYKNMIKKQKPYLNPEMFSIFIIKNNTLIQGVMHITGNPLKGLYRQKEISPFMKPSSQNSLLIYFQNE